jgi:hypothetical protein
VNQGTLGPRLFAEVFDAVVEDPFDAFLVIALYEAL